jgi:hypothetical protein
MEIDEIIRLVAIPALGYMAYFVVRMERCMATVKAQLASRATWCKARGEWLEQVNETAKANHTNVKVIAAHLGLGDEMET